MKGPGQPAAFPARRHAGFWDIPCFPWVMAKGGVGSKCPAWEGPRLPLLLLLLSRSKIMPALQGDPAGTQGPCWLCKGRKHQGTAPGSSKPHPGRLVRAEAQGLPLPAVLRQRHGAATARHGLFHLRSQSKTQTECCEREEGEVKPRPCDPYAQTPAGFWFTSWVPAQDRTGPVTSLDMPREPVSSHFSPCKNKLWHSPWGHATGGFRQPQQRPCLHPRQTPKEPLESESSLWTLFQALALRTYLLPPKAFWGVGGMAVLPLKSPLSQQLSLSACSCRDGAGDKGKGGCLEGSI